ncbi:ABC transporter substrate-binding protein [Nonlabens sp. Asnod2-A12]|uniref:ABC transporter substrate-binding protein n=1 Tax=Nonlabens sp. Asnod2-A12 TaxID=3160578 RepID=UPI00386B24A3
MFCKIPDQLGRMIELDQLPQRIISLVPSQTELLIDLGLADRLVGVTRYCIHPAGLIDEKTVVGGTKKIVESRIIELQPDLIICNREENNQKIVEFCDHIAPTYVSDIDTLEQALEMIADVGEITGTKFKAKSLIRNISSAFKTLPKPEVNHKALYLIWKKPYMAVGTGTFINDMLARAGFSNAAQELTRYPELDMEAMIKLQPDAVFLSSEPYPFTTDDIAEMKLAFLTAPSQDLIKPNVTPDFKVVDGELFSWYGSRLLKTPEYLQSLQPKNTDLTI